MDRLRDRIRRALAGGERVARPGPVQASGAEVGADLVLHFGQELQRVQGRLIRVADEAAARGAVERIAEGGGVAWAEEDPPEAALREATVGVDRADVLIAETGTVGRMFPSREAARVTLVPPVAVFLAWADALVRDLPSALERLEPAHEAGRAYAVLITGPSRTADIEKMLVIPAHGPRELVVILIEGD